MKTFYTLILCLSLTCAIQAQDGLPPEGEHGKCYAKCVTSDEYKEEVIKVMVKPPSKKLKVIPAQYKKVTEDIVIKPASKIYRNVPAVYKTVTEDVVIKEPYNKLSIIPAKFQPDSEKIQIKPEIGKWEMGGQAPDCKSVDPNDCRLVWYRKYPAQYAEIPIQKLAQNATTEKTTINSNTKKITKEVEVSPARYEEVAIPAETIKVTRQVLLKDESTEVEEMPARYKEVTKRVLVKKGGMTVWREVPCEFVDGVVLPINYSVGSAVLTSKSKKLIDDNLLKLLKDEPLVHVEINSHTDSRGNDASNQSLSQKRAQSVVDYLISKGVERSRMVAKGFGEAKLKNSCANGIQCTETQHRENRRTEFRITSR